MPIFEYKCAGCGTRFEKLIRREAEEAEVLCPSCGAAGAGKELSTFAAHAKSGPSAGSGPVGPMPCGAACPTPGLCGRN
jgi:putative FmdB family regulatory protein